MVLNLVLIGLAVALDPLPLTAFPFSMVRPEMVTAIPPLTVKISTELFPLMARLDAPGPLMVRL